MNIVAAIDALHPELIYMNEHTFVHILNQDGRFDGHWRQLGARNRIKGVVVRFVEEMPDGEWIFF